MTLGQHIQTFRARADLSVQQVAAAVGVTTQAVYHWENDKPPSVHRLRQLAEVLRLSDEEVGTLVRLSAPEAAA